MKNIIIVLGFIKPIFIMNRLDNYSNFTKKGCHFLSVTTATFNL
jgi:hypothetical protein